MGKVSTFIGLLERATSQLQLEPDWASILQICDSIRQQDVTPKFAVAAIKKKMFEKNPHVSKFALTVLEACMKNCGSSFHDEIATKEFMEEMRNLIRNNQDPVKDMALGLIQTWSHAFRNESKYKIIQDTYNLMKMEGCQFPSFKESDAMFSADCAPAWAEGDVCHMCRVKFGTFIRQHHCRKCGQVFCKKCSSKESIIPQFGIEREVRVCDPCYFQLNPQSKTEKSEKSSEGGDLPAEYLNSSLSKESQAPPKRDPQQIKEQEEEELQLAMALSLSQEEAQKEKKPLARSWPSTSSNRTTSSIVLEDEESAAEMDPDLARYLNRSYWEGRKEQQSSGYIPPSAPEPPPPAQTTEKIYAVPYSNHSELEEQVSEAEQSSETLVNNFRSTLEMLSEQMQTVSSKGKHIAMDATVQSLFQTVSAMHPQLLRMIEQQEEETGKFEALKERLGLVKEARGTLEDAREQHREKVRQQELEQDMLRRMQIEQKLELMRQQKAEYMAYQQRLQAERQMALEQQHQQLRYQNYPQQQFAGQYVAADGSVPYASMGYMPPSSMPPPSVPQAEGSPYSSLNYVPPSNIPHAGVPPSNLPPQTNLPPPSNFSPQSGLPPSSSLPPPSNMPPGSTQADGSLYSSLNYIPPASVSPGGIPNTSASIPGPTAPGGPNDLHKGNPQPQYNQPHLKQSYPPQAYPGMGENPPAMENPPRSLSPHFGQAPPSYSQVDYNSYGPNSTNSISGSNNQPSSKQPGVPDYLQAREEPIPSSTYQQPTSQVHPGQPNMNQQPYGTPLNPASSYPPQASPQAPPQYAQAANQPPVPHYDGNQQGFPPQVSSSQPQPHQQLPLKSNNQVNQLPPQYAVQQQGNMQHPDPSGYIPSHVPQQQQNMQPQQQQQNGHQQQQQLMHQQPPPPLHQQQQMYEPQPQQMPAGAAPYTNPQQYQPPHQQQQQQPPQHLQQPQQQQPQQQQYQAPPQQQQLQNQYYPQQPQQPSGPPPQRQMSDLELISFD